MEKCLVNDVIKIAKKYVGYLEKETNNNLDSFTVNAGDENYTRFAREFKKFAGIDNQGNAWCDMLVDCCFVEAFGVADAKELLGGFSAYTPTSAQYFKSKKQWYESKPIVGDIIFFKNSERICHTGIVYKVDNTYVYTIEGNTSAGDEVIPNGGAVCEKKYVLNNSRIAGYGRPKYDRYIPTSTITKDSSDEDIEWLQEKLNNALESVSGFMKLDVDSKFGNKTIAAVIRFYELQGWKTDGTQVGKYAIERLSKY